MAGFAGVPEEALRAGIDGCSAPNYAMPLVGLARAFARLATAETDDAAVRARACATARCDGRASGDGFGRAAAATSCCRRPGAGDWIPKIGAEGVQAIGVRSRGWGMAIKVADGSKRGLFPAVVAVLDQLGLLDSGRRARLAALREPDVSNYRGTPTGVVRPVVVLDRRRGARRKLAIIGRNPSGR